MEYAGTWNRLTAALHLGMDAGDDRAWALIVAQGLVDAGGRPQFDEALAAWAQREAMPGPSKAAFIAGRLHARATEVGLEPDGHGAIALRGLAREALRRGRLDEWREHRRRARAARARVQADRRRSRAQAP